MSRPLLEVIAVDATDARNAAAGGADRLELVSAMEHSGFNPSPETVAAVRDAVDLPVRVMIRLRDGFSAGGAEGVATLVGSVTALRKAGATEFVLGWLDRDGRVDLEAVHAVLDVLDGAPWTFHKAIDAATDRDAVYADVTGLPGLDTVLTSGGPFGAGDGIGILVTEKQREQARGGPQILVGGGLKLPHVRALLDGGLRGFHVGSAVRDDGSWTSPVSVAAVEEWRAALG